jgi:hypothetical protein
MPFKILLKILEGVNKVNAVFYKKMECILRQNGGG